jgi:hypothetical protein
MTIQINGQGFALNANMEYTGDPENQDELNAFNLIKQAHVEMTKEFKDPKNIGEFILLMANGNANPFLEYNYARGREF